jgi:hypothetical protein
MRPRLTRFASRDTSMNVGRSSSPGWSSPTWRTGRPVLYGTIVDQAALHGLLSRVRDLGLLLVTVRSIGPTGEVPAARTLTT